MPSIFDQTAALLQSHAAFHEAVLVAYSGGKDSLVVLDLCSRHFKRVVAFFMYLVEGLEVIDDRLEYARTRWKVEIRQYPHWSLGHELDAGIYGPRRPGFEKLAKVKASDVYAAARRDTGIGLVLTGDKKADFVARRAHIRVNKDPLLAFPLADWRNEEVAAYLQTRDIPLPDSEGDHGGVGLALRSLLWLWDKHPADFARLEQTFPFIGAAVKRREWYGQKEE
jgi:phosphoadenosine phosphosulfate reductase